MWRSAATHEALGGIAATHDIVVFGDRGPLDKSDMFRCVDAKTGETNWVVSYPAPGELDYGNSPRATPLILEDRVVLLGAMGHLHCVDRAAGAILWKKELTSDFGVTDERPWGTCESPLVVDGKLIVRPGSRKAAIVALDPVSGEVIWQSSGRPPAYGSLIAGEFGSVAQIIGYDDESLGGWDVTTGKRIWRHKFEHEDDFNVPTPVRWGERLLVASENNGLQVFDFGDDGQLLKSALTANLDVTPDMSSPVAIGNDVFALFGSLSRLKFQDGELTIQASIDDDAFATYGSVIASRERLLVVGTNGEAMLYDTRADGLNMVSRVRLVGKSGAENYAHPAIVGKQIFVRGAHEVICISLEDSQD